MATLLDYLDSPEGQETIKGITCKKWSGLSLLGGSTAEQLLDELRLLLWEGIRQIHRCAKNRPELSLEDLERVSKSRKSWKELVLSAAVDPEQDSAEEDGFPYRLPWYAIKALQDGTVIWNETISDNKHRNYLMGVINSIASHEYKEIKEYRSKHTSYIDSLAVQGTPSLHQEDEEEFDPRDESLRPDDWKWENEVDNTDPRDEDSLYLEDEKITHSEPPPLSSPQDNGGLEDILEKDNSDVPKKTPKGKNQGPYIRGNEVSRWENSAAYRPLDPVVQSLISEEEALEHDRNLNAILNEFKGILSPRLREVFEVIWEIQEDVGFDNDLTYGINKTIAAKLRVSDATVSRSCKQLKEVYQVFHKKRSSTTKQGDSE